MACLDMVLAFTLQLILGLHTMESLFRVYESLQVPPWYRGSA